MPLLLQHRHQTLLARPSKRGCLACLHLFRGGLHRTLYQHPEQNVSWPSLPLLEEPGRVHPHPLPFGSVSTIRHISHHFPHSRASAPPHANPGASTLLELSNSVRESLAKQDDFGPRADCMSFFLELALQEEQRGVPTLDFETVKIARLDKLVAALIECGESSDHLLPRYVHAVVAAEKLDRLWRTRFKLDYFMMGEIRARDLATRWRLDGRPVRLRSSTSQVSLVLHELGSAVDPTAKAGFSSGGWWLDITCAYLDGVVATEYETTSKGHDGVFTLPLLTGREVSIGSNRVRYFREGTLADMHPALIPQTGKHVRVLRGHLLHSHLAPAAGIRNDGLWKVLKFRESLDKINGRCRLEVDLEKAPGELPTSELEKIPRPSHLDDWFLYRTLKEKKASQVKKTRIAWCSEH
ncbi:hypothetical protein N658DRAFT_32878 [Parathielavia hyrcaniae]|uniref:Uncharacterized protein n=1 Tax=Parathielavia hyrcaniae TaxID=113614 RepID=A0AAN6T7J4_9PEZI|nr:hypothetical protein N658DRAFT_32878 [Parathielavia hyrcaniae]